MAQATPPPEYDCLVLSGGGAKGAYGAGAAKALEVYRAHRGITRPVCYVGASAGALNAYILAAQDADALVEFWRNVSNRSVLGTGARPNLTRLIARNARIGPYSVYDNGALRKLIEKNASLADLKNPLIVAATDYKAGSLKAFYAGEVIQRLVEDDAKQSVRAQRLSHLRPIASDEVLVEALLASAAIPIFFPPVKITTERGSQAETSWYVDGGLGNNTPTREAAYFFRYLQKLGLGRAGTVFCVSLDQPQVFQDETPFGLLDIINRTREVYQYVHTTPIVQGWTRINYEVETQSRRVEAFNSWLDKRQLSAAVRRTIKRQAAEIFAQLGGKAARVSAAFVLIEPSTDLGDVFNFEGRAAEKLIRQGYNETLKALSQTRDPRTGTAFLDEVERIQLINRPIW